MYVAGGDVAGEDVAGEDVAGGDVAGEDVAGEDDVAGGGCGVRQQVWRSGFARRGWHRRVGGVPADDQGTERGGSGPRARGW